MANADGSNERALLPANQSVFEYHAHFSPDGKYVTFTSEKEDGNADLYRIVSPVQVSTSSPEHTSVSFEISELSEQRSVLHYSTNLLIFISEQNVDGTGMTSLVNTPSLEIDGVMSPDGTQLAYVSTANGYVSNIWVMDLETGVARNLTNTADTVGAPTEESPDGHYRPAWSPDGEWILFSSDRNTDWTGHNNGTGWEHTQELSVYAIRPNGSDFRQVATKSGYSLGTPTWSPDGSRVAFYEIAREDTYNCHRPESINSTTSQIVSVDFATGADRIEHTSGAGIKFSPQWVTNSSLGYLVKGVETEGLNYTEYTGTHQQFISSVRNPSWSANGTQVVYERTGWDIRPLEKKLYSWQDDWEYRHMDVFPLLSKTGRLVYTAKQSGSQNSSVVHSKPDGSDMFLAFDSYSTGQLNSSFVNQGLAGSFQPTWSPDEEWIVFGLGYWFFERALYTGYLYRVTANGSYYEQLTDGSYNTGYPSYSPDGTQIVYRAWDWENGALGLKIMNLTDKSVTNLTDGWDNTPGWSPDGTKIVFTRQTNWTTEYGGRWYSDRFEICTINPDGTDTQILTTSGANDAHAVWTADNKIMWSSGMYGFRDECATYDDTFQPYGQIMIMEKDGSDKRMLTDSMWEDSMPLFVPNEFLE